MLPAAHRMRSSVDFTAAVRRGRRAGKRTLVLHYQVDAAQASRPARIGFVVSKAVGGAVVRNRVKRRLRHLVTERLTQLPPGSLLVVRANPPSAAVTERLVKDLDSALKSVTGPGTP